MASICESVWNDQVRPVIVQLSVRALDDVEIIERSSNPIAWSREQLAAEFANPLARFFGARFAGELVAFILIQLCLDEAHILSLGVLPEKRGLGIGGSLLIEALHEIHFEGIRNVYLEVRKSNAIARRLYGRLGFCEVQERPRYYYNNGEDAVVMSLALDNFAQNFVR